MNLDVYMFFTRCHVLYITGVRRAIYKRLVGEHGDDYPHPQSVEARIVAEMGAIIYGPYTGRWFSSTRETDIEHTVARSEAHDSGLCAADSGTRRRFASDLLNLTLASPGVNRHRRATRTRPSGSPT